jgi:solute carrier family 25 S-adenosylmethionine transporter 26
MSLFCILFLFQFAVIHIHAAATLTAAPPRTTRTPKSSRRHKQSTTRLPLIQQHETALLESKRRGGASSSAWMVGLKDSVASALAAACSKTILAPFDTIKTIQQQYTCPSGNGSLGFLPACRLICSRPNGFWSMYAGLGVSVLGSMPSVGLYFGVYSYCKRTLYPLLKKELPHVSNGVLWTVSIAASAAVGNTVASFSRVPYEVVKQNLQTNVYANTKQAVTQMYASSGWRAFFPMGGVSIQMMRDIPYAMVTLLSYEYLRLHFVNPYKQDKHPEASWCDMLAGAVAGGIGSYATNPFDVLKTRLQTNPSKYHGSIIKCATATWHEGGAMAFLRGSVPRLLHKVPANGAFFLFYEFFRRLLHVADGTTTTSTSISTKKK